MDHLMMFFKFILIFSLTFSTMDSAIYTKLASLTIKTQNEYYAGTSDDIRIKLFSEHNT